MTVANPSDYEIETGLEDFDQSDAVTPRITIVHKEGLFKDGLSGEKFDKLTCIILGLVKQRNLWHNVVDEGDYPMCRSQNHDTGFPNMSDKQPQDKRFPWPESGFDPAAYPPDANGLVRLPCDSCQLKEWGSHPDGKKPYCAEQFTLPVLYAPPGGGDLWVPAIISFQKTALKGLKAYLTGFQRARQGAYMAVTEIGLDMFKRGSNDYSVPNFRKVGDTEDSHWREYAAGYRQMRDFLTADPDDEFDDTPSVPAAAAPVPAAPAPVETGDVVDAVVVEDPPAAPPAQTPAPTPPAAPAVQPPAPPAAPTPTPVAATPAPIDDDDLPF